MRSALLRRASRVLMPAVLFACAAHVHQPAVPSTPRPLAFVDVSMVPMDTERVVEHQTVRVVGDRIVAVGPVSDMALTAGATRIDGRGKYLMPGLADMHVHVDELIYTYFEYDVSEAAAQKIPIIAAEIRKAGLTVTPTLVTYDRIVRQVADLDTLLRDPATAYIRPYELATWQRENNRYLRNP